MADRERSGIWEGQSEKGEFRGQEQGSRAKDSQLEWMNGRENTQLQRRNSSG